MDFVKVMLFLGLLKFIIFFIRDYYYNIMIFWSTERLHEELIKRKNWCIEMERMKADSSKRIGQSKTADQSILGVEGNFKRLNFD